MTNLEQLDRLQEIQRPTFSDLYRQVLKDRLMQLEALQARIEADQGLLAELRKDCAAEYAQDQIDSHDD